MRRLNRRRKTTGAVLLLLVCAAISAGIFYLRGRERVDQPEISKALVRSSQSPDASSDLPGEMCPLPPLGQEVREVAFSAIVQSAAAAADAAPVSGQINQAPVRILRDTYPGYSAVGIDMTTDDVYLQDENLFGLKVFNRLDNTPPKAKFTEPKRVVGGEKTKLQFNCSLYVDPKSGDVYSVTNDFVDTLTVFSRQSRGDVLPKRELFTPHRTWGIAVDEEAQEMYLTVEHPPAVVAYNKYAQGSDKPLRRLAGSQTKLEDPHGIALDGKNRWIFVSNHGAISDPASPGSGRFDPPSITVYPWKATGDTPPLRVIQGPKTQLNWPSTLFADEERGELYVANDADNSILVFRTSDSGDAAPTRVIKGPKTGLQAPTGLFVDLKHQELWVANMGNHRATVYSLTADGDVAPKRTIRSAPEGQPSMVIGNPGSVAYDSKRDRILVPN